MWFALIGRVDDMAVKSFFDWVSQGGYSSRDWLVVGKGPSYQPLSSLDLDKILTVSLNHVCRENRVHIAHIADLDVFEDCAEAVFHNADFLLMPWYPHVNHAPGIRSLENLAQQPGVLREMAEAGRLLYYISSLSVPEGSTEPVVTVQFFSGDAVLSLLALTGVKTVYTLGIDGGSSYSAAFDDLQQTTLLSNGRFSFDCQSSAIGDLLVRHDMQVSPLLNPGPVKIYVGSQKEQMLAVKVLEFSVRRHASMSVDVIPMHLQQHDMVLPRDASNQPRTPFSFQRFSIPGFNGFRGRAIYLDSDMMVFRDIKSLWLMDMVGADLLSAHALEDGARKPQFSVMLLDCEKLPWNIRDIVARLDAGEWTYEALMHDMKAAKVVSPSIDPSWNSLEHYDPQTTNLLHYTDMNRQPWLVMTNPLAYLWVDELVLAVKRGFIDLAEIKADILAGYVRPSLYWQVTHRKMRRGYWKGLLNFLDWSFVPPHVKAAGRKSEQKNTAIHRLHRRFVSLLTRLS